MVEEIARTSQIPIEALCQELSQNAYPRGQVVFGFAGDEVDKITQNYPDLEWWVSDRGLNVAVSRQPSSSDDLLELSKSADKGNLDLLRGLGGVWKTYVTSDVASRFGGVTRRAIEKAVRKGSIESLGQRANRRIRVASLLRYFPPENNAN